jgi:hypothetical protein
MSSRFTHQYGPLRGLPRQRKAISPLVAARMLKEAREAEKAMKERERGEDDQRGERS